MTERVLPADREWLTAAEAAAEMLTGCAHSADWFKKRMIYGEFKRRRRVTNRCSARPFEFHWSNLPSEAADAYFDRHAVSNARAA